TRIWLCMVATFRPSTCWPSGARTSKKRCSSHRTQDTLQTIFALKKDFFLRRKRIAPNREVVNVLLRRDHALFGDEFFPYFQDVYDHTVRVMDTLDTYRDLLFISVGHLPLDRVQRRAPQSRR